jgi:hypothetical protein
LYLVITQRHQGAIDGGGSRQRRHAQGQCRVGKAGFGVNPDRCRRELLQHGVAKPSTLPQAAWSQYEGK